NRYMVADHQGRGHQGGLEHDPEKWTPVFGQDHAQTKILDHDPIQLNWIMVWPEPAHDRYASTARLYPDRAETDAWRGPTVTAGAEPAAAAVVRSARVVGASRAGPEPISAAAERQPARADRSDAARRRP